MDKEHVAIMRLQDAARLSEAHYGMPLIITIRGGKDSATCLEMARRAGIDFECVHHLTTVDAPETIYYIRSEYKRLEEAGVPADRLKIAYPYYKGRRITMWTLIPEMGTPPTRIMRYCCRVLKEESEYTNDRYIVTGVRWAESTRRAKTRGVNEITGETTSEKIILNNDNDDKRKLTEACLQRNRIVCNPIIDWTDADVWRFIKDAKVPLNPLYECGYGRVGCIGCPMGNLKAKKDAFARYPTYKQAYIKAFDRMLAARKAKGLKDFGHDCKNGEDVLHWWIEDDVLKGQISFDDLEAEND